MANLRHPVRNFSSFVLPSISRINLSIEANPALPRDYLLLKLALAYATSINQHGEELVYRLPAIALPVTALLNSPASDPHGNDSFSTNGTSDWSNAVRTLDHLMALAQLRVLLNQIDTSGTVTHLTSASYHQQFVAENRSRLHLSICCQYVY